MLAGSRLRMGSRVPSPMPLSMMPNHVKMKGYNSWKVDNLNLEQFLASGCCSLVNPKNNVLERDNLLSYLHENKLLNTSFDPNFQIFK